MTSGGAMRSVVSCVSLHSTPRWASASDATRPAGPPGAISTPAHPLHLDAGFSPGGWLAVILTFVLARVFAEGTLMREDLEGTV